MTKPPNSPHASTGDAGRSFTAAFQEELFELMKWRRDVRHFSDRPVDSDLLLRALTAFQLSPSVGLSEPWRIVNVASPSARQLALQNFQTANADALAGYNGDKAATYAGLKLTGMQDAPVQLAVFCDDGTAKGSGLGAQTMPEVRRYSVVSAIMSFWLAARAKNLGVGWVSILDPSQLCTDLNVDPSWSLVAYLCVGWPKQNTTTPELETVGWESRNPELMRLIER